MATLPYEVIHLIFTYLMDKILSETKQNIFTRMKHCKLAQYTVISRQWQAIVEPIIWQQICTDSVEKLQQFTSGDPYRRARVGYIQHILWQLEFSYGPLLKQTQGFGETFMQLLPDWYHQQFLSQVRSMLQWLDSWKGQVSDISLSLWSCDNSRDGDAPDEDIEPDEMASLTLDQLWKLGQISYLLDLTAHDFQNMPMPACVGSFQVHDSYGTTVQPSVFFHMLNCFPCVKHVSFIESEFIPQDALWALRRQRKEVTDHLGLVPKSVETFRFSIPSQRELSLNPARDAANYLSPNGLDKFSSTFRTLSMQLQEVYLEGVRVSGAFFWPEAGEDIDKTTLYWPSLEGMKILEMPPYTADGKWILDNDPTEDWGRELEENSTELWEYDRDYYAKRGLIKSHELDKLYEALGHAAHKMPRLHTFEISFRGASGDAGNLEYLDFKRDLITGQTSLEINTEWQYHLGEGVISAWGLKGEKADEFRRHHSLTMDGWPLE